MSRAIAPDSHAVPYDPTILPLPSVLSCLIRDYLPVGWEGIVPLGIFPSVRPFSEEDIIKMICADAKNGDLRSLLCIQQYISKSGIAFGGREEGDTLASSLTFYAPEVIHACLDAKTSHCLGWVMYYIGEGIEMDEDLKRMMNEAIRKGKKGPSYDKDWAFIPYTEEEKEDGGGLDMFLTGDLALVAFIRHGNIDLLRRALDPDSGREWTICDSILEAAVRAGIPYLEVICDCLEERKLLKQNITPMMNIAATLLRPAPRKAIDYLSERKKRMNLRS